MKWIVVGAGVIGERRAMALPESCQIAGVVDTNLQKAEALAKKISCPASSDLSSILKEIRPEAAIIATINSALVDCSQKCLDSGVHILIEKPAARSYQDLKRLKNSKGLVIKIGFNHRFHPAYTDLCAELKNSADPIMYIRARYGNGARVGFEHEWRARVETSGGGELLDQGVHVIDLASHLLGNLDVQTGYCKTHYWPMEVDDNAWGILANHKGQTFSFHVSSSEWKNEFQFDVYTRQKKYTWAGLGRSYGTETLTIYKMKPEMGPPDIEKRDYPGDDLSWRKENENFLAAIQKKETCFGGLEDALHCLKMVEKTYLASKKLQGDQKHPQWLGS